jgi:hypothetical protein
MKRVDGVSQRRMRTLSVYGLSAYRPPRLDAGGNKRVIRLSSFRIPRGSGSISISFGLSAMDGVLSVTLAACKNLHATGLSRSRMMTLKSFRCLPIYGSHRPYLFSACHSPLPLSICKKPKNAFILRQSPSSVNVFETISLPGNV